jgi:E3 ubiquitin-protein ligase UBR2
MIMGIFLLNIELLIWATFCVFSLQPPTVAPTPQQVQGYIKEAVLPFLRCCAVFFHYLTGVSPPEALLIGMPINLFNNSHSTVLPTDHCGEEFELLCQYLSLPSSLSSHFHQGEILQHLVHSWCSDDATKQKLAEAGSYSTVSLIRYPIEVNELVPLPHDYSELISKVSTFT